MDIDIPRPPWGCARTMNAIRYLKKNNFVTEKDKDVEIIEDFFNGLVRDFVRHAI